MRIALLVLVGCGRIAFEPLTGDGGVVVPDDAVDAPGDGSQAGGPTVYLVSSNSPDSELFTVDLATGQLTLVGMFSGLGTVGGLAYWDANTIYATSNNSLIRITLSPFAAVMVSSMVGTWAAIERDGNAIFGVDQDNDSWGRFDPENAAGLIPLVPMGFNSTGSDVTFVDGSWWYFANTGQQLRRFDGSDFNPVGTPDTSAPFNSGMVHDDSGNLWMHSGDSNELYRLDKVSGQIVQTVPVCLACPTPYDIQSGDMTRSP